MDSDASDLQYVISDSDGACIILVSDILLAMQATAVPGGWQLTV